MAASEGQRLTDSVSWPLSKREPPAVDVATLRGPQIPLTHFAVERRRPASSRPWKNRFIGRHIPLRHRVTPLCTLSSWRVISGELPPGDGGGARMDGPPIIAEYVIPNGRASLETHGTEAVFLGAA